MNSLIRFLLRYHILFLFVVLESLALVLISSDSIYQRYRIVSAARSASGSLHSWVGGMSDYLELGEQNDILVRENLTLRQKLAKYESAEKLNAPAYIDTLNKDTLGRLKYRFFSAKVVGNSVNKQHNFITIKAGTDDGVRPRMGVITGNGVVGIVTRCSNHFSTVMSILNTDSKTSGKLRRSGYFGSLYWNGTSADEVTLAEIPQNADIVVGDTIVSSGYSSMFPEGITLGYVKSFDKVGGSFYRIQVKLAAEFRKLNYVYIVDNLQYEEQTQLEIQEAK